MVGKSINKLASVGISISVLGLWWSLSTTNAQALEQTNQQKTQLKAENMNKKRAQETRADAADDKNGDTSSKTSATTVPIAPADGAPIQNQPLASTAGERILFLGDSHSVATFGRTLDADLRTRPHAQVTTVASCGSDPVWWFDGTPTHCGFWLHQSDGSEQKTTRAPTPKLPELLQEHQPSVVIVALGSNMVKRTPTERITHTEEMMQSISSVAPHKIWIGPPDARIYTDQQIDEIYQTLYPLCQKYGFVLIDSRQFTKYPAKGGDGLHFQGEAGVAMAASWGHGVFAKITENLAQISTLPSNQ